MYSWEDPMKAVTLYVESKFSENQVIKSLGYPSPNTLRSWYREYVTAGLLHTESRRKPHYSSAQYIEDFMASLDTYIRWYNTARIKESLGWMSPMEYRASLGLL